MKKTILAAMAALTFAGSLPADAAFNYNGEIYNSGWDLFWIHPDAALNILTDHIGTQLDPANTGWNDFWYQCQDPNKTAHDCVGTIAAGVGLAVGAPIVAIAAGGAIATTGPGIMAAGPILTHLAGALPFFGGAL